MLDARAAAARRGLRLRPAADRDPRRAHTRADPLAESLDLLGCERAELPRLEALRRHRPERDPPQLRDRVAHGLEEPPHLVLPALVQRDLDPRVVVGLEHAHAVDRHQVLVHAHAPAQALESVLAGHARHLRVVDAGHLVARVRHALREAAVVREQDEALGRHVETPDREEAGDRGDEAHHRWPVLGVASRGDDAARLVQDEVDERPRRLHSDAVDADVVRLDVGLRPQLADDLAVDRDAALEHQLLRAAPRGEARARQDLLEPLLHEPSLSFLLRPRGRRLPALHRRHRRLRRRPARDRRRRSRRPRPPGPPPPRPVARRSVRIRASAPRRDR